MEKTKSFKELLVWQKAHQLVLNVYAVTKMFPKEELFGLTSQLRRSAVSVPANISEGYRKRTKPDKAKYINIAQGSLDETNYYLLLAKDLAYADTTQLQSDPDEIARMLNACLKAVQS